MNFFFSSPLMLSAFSAVPALVAIYLLRNRFRTQVVSSLILWIDQRRARQGVFKSAEYKHRFYF